VTFLAPQVVGGGAAGFRPEALFLGGENQWDRGFCGCRPEEAVLWIVANACCSSCFVPQVLLCVWGSQFYSAMGSPSGFCNCLAGACFAPYGTGKMAHALNVREDVDAEFCLQWGCCYLCQFLRFKAEAEDKSAQLKHVDQAGTQPWKQPLTSCCDDPVLAALVCCVPCVPMGQFYETFGKNCCLYGLCGCVCLEYTRGKVVAAKGIREPFLEYAAKRIFCAPCATCQLFAELKEDQGALVAAQTSHNGHV